MKNSRNNTNIDKAIAHIFERELRPQVRKDLLKQRLQQKLSEETTTSFPGKVETDKVLKTSSTQNDDAMNAVAEKIKSYLDFKNNSHPDFPHQNNSKTDYYSPMYRNSTEEEDYIDDWRGMGLEDAEYQTNPSERFKERVTDYVEGSSDTGNAMTNKKGDALGNVVPSDLGQEVLQKVKRKYDKLKSDEWGEAIPNRYGKQKPNPGHMVSEAIKEVKALLRQKRR